METYSFGEWVSQRRKARDLGQRELAARAGCALATIKKIEADERRPSRDLAMSLAKALDVPTEWRQTFIECARGLRPVDALAGLSGGAAGAQSASSAQAAAALPVPATPFVPREAELAQVADLLAQPACRLLTLIGPGGIGKTRLALEAARTAQEQFPDGVAFVPLASVTDAALLPTAIAHSLRLVLTGPPQAQLAAYLRSRRLLLMLDNCEQLGAGSAWLSELLAQAPGLKLLATSRERLQLAEEWVYTVPELGEGQAVELFAQAARRARPSFDPAAQAEAITAIGRLVDNLPLAVELAAGWVPFMTCEQIAEHIRRDLDFLAASVRNVPERHRSLRAVFDHSWSLLTADEQAALMRLSVFRGGWAGEQAAPVAGADLSRLRSLVDKSLVRATGLGRYDLHELTRQYAADKLRAAGLDSETRRQHAAVYLALARRLDLQLLGPDAVAGYARLDQEQDNFHAALAWALEAGQADTALRLVNSLWYYWYQRGYWQEGGDWTEAAVRLAGEADSVPLCRALIDVMLFRFFQGQFEVVEHYVSRAKPMAWRLEDPGLLADVGFTDWGSNDLAKERDIFDQVMSLLEASDDPHKWARIARFEYLAGDRLLIEPDLQDEAAAHYQRSLDLYRQMGNVDVIAYPLGNLGRLRLQEGQVQAAYDLIAESVAISRAVGNRLGVADWVQQLGKVALYLGDIKQAETCLQEALRLHEEIGSNPTHVLAVLGHVALARGDVAQAARYLHDSLAAAQKATRFVQHASRELLLIFISAADSLLRRALVAVAQGDLEAAATLLGHVERQCTLKANVLEPPLRAAGDEAVATLRAQLSPAAFQRAWDAGQALSLEQALALALER